MNWKASEFEQLLTEYVRTVCGITSTWNPIDDPEVKHPIISDVIGVAGEYGLSHGGNLEPKITRLKTTDKGGEGIDIELHGGSYNDRKQKAVVSFLCEADFTGNEGYDDEEDKRRARSMSRRAEDKDDDDDDDEKSPENRYKQDEKNAIQFVSYGEEGEGKDRLDVLRLNWRTKYACEKSAEEGGGAGDDDSEEKAGWGFFTWFILLYVV